MTYEPSKEAVEAALRALHLRGAHGCSISVVRQALIAAHEAEDGWRPIETAPKDGTKIDLWCVSDGMIGTRVPYAHWCDRWCFWGDEAADSDFLVHEYGEPTHWRPLPPPPKGETI